jgi:hypothetical protein
VGEREGAFPKTKDQNPKPKPKPSTPRGQWQQENVPKRKRKRKRKAHLEASGSKEGLAQHGAVRFAGVAVGCVHLSFYFISILNICFFFIFIYDFLTLSP